MNLGNIRESITLRVRDTNQTGTDKSVFEEDIAGIKQSNVVLAIAENESPNWGVEVGFSHGIGKKIVALAKSGHEIPSLKLMI